MILDRNLTIKITRKNIDHYSKFFETHLSDIIQIDILNHLQKGSNRKVNVACDICGIKRYIKYQSYIFNINSNLSYPIYTCDKCSHIKIKSTNLERYGVEYYSKSDEFIDKVRKTSIDKFGYDHFSKTPEYLESRNKTNLEKFGMDNPFRDYTKMKKDLFNKYAISHPFKIAGIMDRFKENIRITNETNGNWIPLVDKSDWDIYKKSVRSLTRINIKKLDWNGVDFYDGEFIKSNFKLNCFDNRYPTIDHKVSLFYGFKNGLTYEFISSVDNLCWTKRIINIKKGIN